MFDIKNSKILKLLLKRKSSLKITFIYITISIIWILFSDYVITSLNLESSEILRLSVIKGLVFVIITSLMLYALIQNTVNVLKHSKKELEYKDEMYKLVINGTTDGLWHWDIGEEFFYISPGCKEMLGYKDSELKNTLSSWQNLIHPEDALMVIKDLNDYKDKKISKYSCEYRIKMKSSEYKWVIAKGQGIWDSKGNTVHIYGTITDISGRKSAEEKLNLTLKENTRLLDEVIEYDKLKTDFFTNMSHEFRTPLNVILGIVQLIENSQYYPTDSLIHENRLLKYIKTVKQNCHRLLKLISNLIDITEIDSGFLELNLKNCNIVEVVEQITESVSEFIENKSITLTFDTDNEEIITACDMDKLERIMLNLLSNATKYTHPGGEILVSIKDLKEYVLISVKDTGIGIPEEKIKVIFERFRQVNTSLTRDTEGSGIGLSLVKSLVKMHDGIIWVESELGKGSEFFIKFPVRQLPVVLGSDYSLSKNSKRVYSANVEFSDIYNS